MEKDWSYMVFIVVLIFFTVIGNWITVILILTRKVLRAVGNCLLATLALVDLTTGVLLLASNLYSAYVGTWPGGDKWCISYAYIATLSYNMSYTLLAVISVDAYFAVNHPFKYRYYANKKRLAVLVIVIWTVLAAFSLPMSMKNSTIHFTELHVCIILASPDSMFNRAFFIAQYCLRTLLVIIVIVSYSLIFKKVQKHIKMRRNCNRLLAERRTKKASKAAFTMFMVITLFLSSWMPSALLEIVGQICSWFNIRISVTLIMLKVCFNAHYLSPALNPVIYAARKEQLRHQLSLCTTPFLNGTKRVLLLDRLKKQQSLRGPGTKDTL